MAEDINTAKQLSILAEAMRNSELYEETSKGKFKEISYSTKVEMRYETLGICTIEVTDLGLDLQDVKYRGPNPLNWVLSGDSGLAFPLVIRSEINLLIGWKVTPPARATHPNVGE